ncbi:hypothetical protein [Paenibacillus xylanexedens]|uniref:ADP-ribosyltransferase-containing protein n=1 Tax=Paenibacillus xylanexedens TaxID=528191 RepID=UPI0011A48CE5|nr:hypothetical protein [Paenibacillus xylanexedens]
MLTVYHGSPYKFDQFDPTKIGLRATSEGYGFYFTNNKFIASNYAAGGYLYTVSFDGKKSLSSTEKTITRPQLRRFLAKLHETSNGDFLDNFQEVAYHGMQKVLSYTTNLHYDYNDDDVDIIATICNAYGSKEPLKILYEMLGYDHIKTLAEWSHDGEENMLYIALVNDVITIKSVEEIPLERTSSQT